MVLEMDGRKWERVPEAEAVLDSVIEAGELPRRTFAGPKRGNEGILWRCSAQRKARDILGREAVFGDVEVVMVEASSSSDVRFFVLRPLDPRCTCAEGACFVDGHENAASAAALGKGKEFRA
jgi:hypothetical protein